MTRRVLSFAVLALALAACDSADTTSALASADLDDAAQIVANAIALDTGGALEDAAFSASLAASVADGARHPGPDRPGCRPDRAFDDATMTWTATADCQRGRPDGVFSASFARTTTYRFLDADGQPQRERRGAATVETSVLSGTSRVQARRGVHELTSLTTDLVVADLDSELVTVDGTVQRSVADTLRGRRGERTLTATLDLDLDGVQGPRSAARRWQSAVGGSVSGTLVGTLTRTPTGGETETVDLDRSFAVTFPTEGAGRVAQIAIGDRRWRADLETGDVAGL